MRSVVTVTTDIWSSLRAVGSPGIYGKTYSCKEKDASVLFDSVNGKWETQEMSDQRVQTMGKW